MVLLSSQNSFDRVYTTILWATDGLHQPVLIVTHVGMKVLMLLVVRNVLTLNLGLKRRKIVVFNVNNASFQRVLKDRLSYEATAIQMKTSFNYCRSNPHLTELRLTQSQTSCIRLCEMVSLGVI